MPSSANPGEIAYRRASLARYGCDSVSLTTLRDTGKHQCVVTWGHITVVGTSDPGQFGLAMERAEAALRAKMATDYPSVTLPPEEME